MRYWVWCLPLIRRHENTRSWLLSQILGLDHVVINRNTWRSVRVYDRGRTLLRLMLLKTTMSDSRSVKVYLVIRPYLPVKIAGSGLFSSCTDTLFKLLLTASSNCSARAFIVVRIYLTCKKSNAKNATNIITASNQIVDFFILLFQNHLPKLSIFKYQRSSFLSFHLTNYALFCLTLHLKIKKTASFFIKTTLFNKNRFQRSVFLYLLKIRIRQFSPIINGMIEVQDYKMAVE